MSGCGDPRDNLLFNEWQETRVSNGVFRDRLKGRQGAGEADKKLKGRTRGEESLREFLG